MGLSQALSIAMSGLRANQAALSLVSSNVSNSETPGYVRKTTNVVDTSHGVRTIGVNRELDDYVQNQLRTELSGSGYATAKSTFLNNLQGIYGDPGSNATLEASFNALTTALQGLSTSSDSDSARKAVVNAAQTMAAQLNDTSDGIQGLRAAADSGINGAVNAANNAMAQIARINQQIGGSTNLDASTASLLDQRDQYITQLSQLMDVRVVPGDGNQVSVYTGAGFQLVGGPNPAKLSFSPQGTMTPDAQWNPDPSKSDLSSVMLQYPDGSKIDLTAEHGIRSGAIAAYTELRDKTLVQAQAQVDSLAAAMSSALSDKTTGGVAFPPATPAPPPGTPAGFDLDTTGLQNGNTINITYTDAATNTKHNITIVRVDDPSALPLANSATADPNDKVVGIDFSGGMASVVSQLNAALGGTNVQFSNPAGSTLRVLDDGAAGQSDVNSASVTTTATSLTERRSAASVLHRWKFAVYRRHHRRRFGEDRPCGTHRGQSRAAGRSIAARRLQHQSGDASRRHHAVGLHPVATHIQRSNLYAGYRSWRCQDAVQGHASSASRSSSLRCRAMRQPRRDRWRMDRAWWSPRCKTR